MISSGRRLPTVMEVDLPRLTEAVGIMVAAAVAPSAQRVTDATRQIDVVRKERVQQAVRRQPTLAPKTLSRLVGISRSNLIGSSNTKVARPASSSASDCSKRGPSC
jgi:hypothetical protein